jgi:hypothetical protein
MPKNILLAWEFGRNLGHITRLTELAKVCDGLGFSAAWALPAQYACTLTPGALSAMNPSCVVSPKVVAQALKAQTAIHSFADILAALGYNDPFALQEAVIQWVKIFDRFKVERVILDYAPTAQLAAALVNLPATQITNGFDSPPADCPLFDAAMSCQALTESNKQTVRAINASFLQVGKRLNFNSRPTLHDVLRHPTRVFDCIPELDPYGLREENAHYVGPILKTNVSGGPAADLPRTSWHWPGSAGAFNIFVYVRDESLCGDLIEAIQGEANVICFAPTATPETIRALSRRNVCISTRAAHLPQVLPACDLVITYGAANTSAQALLAGVPLLVLPQDGEKQLIANCVAQVGAGLSLPMHSSKVQLQQAINLLLSAPAFKLKAQAIKSKYAHLALPPHQAAARLAGFLGGG